MSADRIAKRFIGAVEDEWQLYSDNSADYTIGAPIGFGASSTVYAARYHPKNQANSTPCALKVLDLDSLPPHSLSLLQRETQLMSLSKHPNVLRVRGSWMDGHKLFIALRLMKKGSAADVMQYGWPGGMEEEVVRCILKQALEGLNYLHINGFIHRDIKAANLLIDDDGTVLLGDLGVAASLGEDTDSAKSNSHKRTVGFDLARPVPLARPQYGKRMSFVGTPCWMAPELIQGKHYDSSADIWSFGITALELSQGRPPRSREAPQKVLLQTVQDAPPSLDRNGGQHKYSRSFQEIIESCLHKDPTKRPTAAQLLQTPFFRSAKKKGYLISTILTGLPPLAQRQERRRRQPASLLTHGSIDSWDFNASVAGSARSGVGSPTTSLYKRAPGTSLDIATGVFEMEPEEEPGVIVRRAKNPSLGDYATPSGLEHEISLRETEPDEQVSGGQERCTPPRHLSLPSSAPPSSSSSTTPSPSPSFSPSRKEITPSSSLSDTEGSKEPSETPTPVPLSRSPAASVHTSSQPHTLKTSRGIPSSPPARTAFTPSTSASPPAPPSLWHKITRRDSVRSKGREEEGDKKQGFLKRTTSRTAQAVGKFIAE